MPFEVHYHTVVWEERAFLVQSIRTPDELVLLVGAPGVAAFDGLALAAQTRERDPSVTQVVGGLLDDEAQSLAGLLARRLGRRVTVGCAVEFDPPEAKAAVARGIVAALDAGQL